jgi:hypothetical protein
VHEAHTGHESKVGRSWSSWCVRPDRTARHEMALRGPRRRIGVADAHHRAGTVGPMAMLESYRQRSQAEIAVVVWLWQAHDQRPDRVLDLLAGDPLPGADQRVPGLLPHVGQVHGVDPVGHLPRAPQVLALDFRGRLTSLFLSGLVDRADHHPAPPRRGVQAPDREPAHHAHRGGGVPGRVVQQPLRPVWPAVPAAPGDTPPVHPRQLAGQRR